MSLQDLVARGRWTYEPAAVRLEGDELRVTAVEGSDAWRTTSDGFVHDSEHGLVEDLSGDVGLEVSFRLDHTEQFDQAALFLRVDDEALRLVRLAWLDPAVRVSAGLLCAAPTRSGLTVTFTGHRVGDPDAALH